MARVFVDIGAHRGETLEVVRRPEYGFDRIYCLEPASDCLPALERIADDRVTILPSGLWSADQRMALHDPGALGASVFERRAGGAGVVDRETSEEVELRDAAA